MHVNAKIVLLKIVIVPKFESNGPSSVLNNSHLATN